MGERENKARQRSKIERKVFIIDPERVQRDHPKCEADAGDVDRSSYALQEEGDSNFKLTGTLPPEI